MTLDQHSEDETKTHTQNVGLVSTVQRVIKFLQQRKASVHCKEQQNNDFRGISLFFVSIARNV